MIYHIVGCALVSVLLPALVAVAQSANELLYFSNQTGPFQLYQGKPDGSNPKLLIREPGYNYWWVYAHPNYTKFITYRSDTATGKNQNDYENAELWQYDSSGSDPVLLIDKKTHHWSAHGVAKYSPDGHKLIMAAVPGGQDWWYGFVTDSGGHYPKQISRWWMIDPAWSPDGSKIVFCGFPNNTPTFDLTKLELFVAEYDRTADTIRTPVQITSGTGRVHDPCFSHRGDRIAFSDGNMAYSDADIKVVDITGDNLTTLVDDNGANGGSIFWSCDDAEIWYHNVTLFVNDFQIRNVNLATRAITHVLKNVNNAFISAHMLCGSVASAQVPGSKLNSEVQPNPFMQQTELRTDIPLWDATLTVHTMVGQTVRELHHLNGEGVVFQRGELPAGMYVGQLSQNNQIIATVKLFIIN